MLRRDDKLEPLFPGRPASLRIGEAILSRMGLAADVLVVVRGSDWEDARDRLPGEVASKLRLVDRGSQFVSTVIGLSSAGLRVAAFSTPENAAMFVRTIAERPFPVCAVVHAVGSADVGSIGYGFQLSAKTPQESIDFALIAQQVTESTLVPGVCCHLADHQVKSIGTVLEPETDLVATWLPDSSETIPAPSGAQTMLFGERRRRVPAIVDLDRPAGIGMAMSERLEAIAYSGVGPFFTDELLAKIEASFQEFGSLTGRFHSVLSVQPGPDPDLAAVTCGPSESLELAAAQIGPNRKRRLGVVSLSVTAPFPEESVNRALEGCSVVSVLGDAAFASRVKASVSAGVYEAGPPSEFGLSLQDARALFENMLPDGPGLKSFVLGTEFAPEHVRVPSLETMHQTIRRSYPDIGDRGLVSQTDVAVPTTPGMAVVIAGTRILSTTTIADALAASCFDKLKRPVSTTSSLAAATSGSAAQSIVSIGSMTPAMARVDPIRAIVSTRADDLVHWTTSDRLAEGAALVLPEKHATRMSPALLSRLDESGVTVLTVDAGADASETQLLLGLLTAWLRSEADFSGKADDIITGLVQRVASHSVWSRADLELASRLATTSETTPWSQASEPKSAGAPEPVAPDEIRQATERTRDFADAGRFWQTVGFAFATEQDETLAPDPYLTSNAVPARTGSFRSSSARLDRLPELYPENCTGCTSCVAFCPESAIRSTTASIESLVDFGTEQVKLAGTSTVQLDRVAKPLSKQAHRLAARDELHQHRSVGQLLEAALEPVIEAMKPAEEARRDLMAAFEALCESIGSLPIVRTEDYFTTPEDQTKGAGELYLLAVDPDACTSCGLCAAVCEDDALGMRDATDELVVAGRRQRDVVEAIQPDVVATPSADDDETPRPFAMDFLMSRKAGGVMVGTDQANPGSGTRLTVKLVCALIEAEMTPRFRALAEEADQLTESLRSEITDLLRETVDVNDFEAFGKRLDALKQERIAASDLAAMVAGLSDQSVDSQRLSWLTQSVNDLQAVGRDLVAGHSGDGRARMTAVLGTGRILASQRQFPFNQFPFPWIHIESGSPVSIAEGLFEGMLTRMSRTFMTLRRARQLAKGLDVAPSDQTLGWRDLTEDEWRACPPVCVFVEDESDVPRSWLRCRVPINIFVLDGNGTLVDDGWGIRLWPLARQDVFTLHGTVASFEHFSEGVRAGVALKAPSVFRLYTPEPIEHGFGTDQTVARMLAAVRSRAFPLLRYDPDPGLEWTDRWSLQGNEQQEEDWVSPADMPAHWMLGESRFRQQFDADVVPDATGQVDLLKAIESNLPLDESSQTVIRLEVEGREVAVGLRPGAVEAVNNARGFWRLLQELAGIRSTALEKARREAEAELEQQIADARVEIEATAQAEVNRVKNEHEAIYHQKLVQKLMAMSGFGPGSEALEQTLREYAEPD